MTQAVPGAVDRALLAILRGKEEEWGKMLLVELTGADPEWPWDVYWENDEHAGHIQGGVYSEAAVRATVEYMGAEYK